MTPPNAYLAYRVLDHIDTNPEDWTQSSWWCGTSGCFAAWAVLLSGEEIYDDGSVGDGFTHLSERAAQLLGFRSQNHMDDVSEKAIYPDGDSGDEEFVEVALFSGDNDREDLGRLVELLFGPRPEPAP